MPARVWAAGLALCLLGVPALADEPVTIGPGALASQPPVGAAAPPPGAAPAPNVTLAAPAMAGPLALSNPPLSFDAGALGKIDISGVVSGLGLLQTNPGAGNPHGLLDLSNAQIILQKPDGLIQFYVQAGAYAIPALGTPYIRADPTTRETYGLVPEAYLTLAPGGGFSAEFGALPTLIGAENTFTFQDMNIERGLLWGQTNAVTRGVQVNQVLGPVNIALSLNDGYFSGRLNWITGEIIWTVSSTDSITLDAGGSLARTGYATPATPLVQNNSRIGNLIYTHSAGAWTLLPNLQFSQVPPDSALGIAHAATSFGAALLVNYAVGPHFSLAGRVEYIGSSGSLADGAPNLLYGPGSQAWSLTITPTWQWGHYFLRAEGSVVRAIAAAPGMEFGVNGNQPSQLRGLLETGMLF